MFEKRGRGVWSSRWAHNPEAGGSNPPPAIFFYLSMLIYCYGRQKNTQETIKKTISEKSDGSEITPEKNYCKEAGGQEAFEKAGRKSECRETGRKKQGAGENRPGKRDEEKTRCQATGEKAGT